MQERARNAGAGRHRWRTDMSNADGPILGIALGGGSARGWAHIGVLKGLVEAGIRPNLVCGTSIGALVGAAYADGELERLERWVLNLTWQNVVGFLDFATGGGLIKGARIMAFFRENFVDVEISALDPAFAAVATDLFTGREVWLREGRVVDAVRASIALPGLFTPVQRDGKLLVDGGLVNPVPVSLCRAMGADIVIGVDVNSDLVGRHLGRRPALAGGAMGASDTGWIAGTLLGRLPGIAKRPARGARKDQPSMLDILASSLDVMQVLITRSRLAGEPADVLVMPRVARLGLMDFHRAETAIAAGIQAVTHALPQIRQLLEAQP
jgi:NTE family protein